MTMNKTWGYKSYDHKWKSAETLIRNLVEAASKGGNYLLNIGPKPDGTIPEESIERLEAIGRWMKVNGESIYGTAASPIDRPTWGRITTKLGGNSTTLYLHVLDWPVDGKMPMALSNQVEECQLLADPKRELTVDRDASKGLVLNLVGERPDPICSLVRRKISGDPTPVERPEATGPKP